ncbi:hypothetical protein FRB95_006829 [Tulasnella sp. JGI-2019a]|nr:hypothetical protein FRB95_006829 [Tulasnella sp. JGI-2019a]
MTFTNVAPEQPPQDEPSDSSPPQIPPTSDGIKQPLQDATIQPAMLGEKRDFWLKYDKLADTKDTMMIDRLNQNLDVLLIFVRALVHFCFVTIHIYTILLRLVSSLQSILPSSFSLSPA